VTGSAEHEQTSRHMTALFQEALRRVLGTARTLPISGRHCKMHQSGGSTVESGLMHCFHVSIAMPLHRRRMLVPVCAQRIRFKTNIASVIATATCGWRNWSSSQCIHVHVSTSDKLKRTFKLLKSARWRRPGARREDAKEGCTGDRRFRKSIRLLVSRTGPSLKGTCSEQDMRSGKGQIDR
jgi:hypothetical protein